MPIQATRDDVAISGHGEVTFYAGETEVPIGFELHVLAPPGASLSNPAGKAIEDGKKIDFLEINTISGRKARFEPTIYRAGQACLDYRVSPPLGLTLGRGGPHKITVTAPSRLSWLWAEVEKYRQPHPRIVKVFYLCCASFEGTGARLRRISPTAVGHGGKQKVTIGGGIWMAR